MITALLCGPRTPFGGIASQFNHLDLRLNLAVAHNVATAIGYGRLVMDRLQQTARRRGGTLLSPAV